ERADYYLSPGEAAAMAAINRALRFTQKDRDPKIHSRAYRNRKRIEASNFTRKNISSAGSRHS
ncbi:MAG: hypothetical protein ACJ795_16800, partial [Ktedonobacteraceae bacterium]